MTPIPLAHSRNPYGLEEPVIDHLQRVAELASEFAACWGGGDEARAAALLHDLGKYGALFQQRIHGKALRVDHSAPGAAAALMRYGESGISVALAVQGHHGGLVSATEADLVRSLDMRTDRIEGRLIADTDVQRLLQQLADDGGLLPADLTMGAAESRDYEFAEAEMLDHRMLYSALVDADSIATEGHFRTDARGYRVRKQGKPLDPERALGLLLAHVDELRGKASTNADGKTRAIQSVRDDLLAACLAAADLPPGLFTLTAPTGAGKTLAMMAFALRHALLHGLRRVIVILPFLNIIDQSAQKYDEVFASLGNEYVWQDHSLARDSGKAADSAAPFPVPLSSETDEGDLVPDPLRGVTQNWDQPIVVSTTVRFFESLFSNRRSDCYKLHNIAGSVILFDEAQTMPVPLAAPTLAALAHLQRRYGCSIVFSTATQPALEHLFEEVEKKRPRSLAGWHPHEIVPVQLDLANRARRVRIQWPAKGERLSWEAIVEAVAAEPQALVIVNLRRHSRHLFNLLQMQGVDDLYHLSTDMCPQHRLDVLEEVKKRLETGEPCRLVSTQCVEAGVDMDFPRVWRALAPLDALAQAAGRCNREGGLDGMGVVTVFEPPPDEGGKDIYPSPSYATGVATVKTMLITRDKLDLLDGDTIQEYFTRYYNHVEKDKETLEEGLQTRNFPLVSKNYEWIEGTGVSLLVPYKKARTEFDALVEQANTHLLNRKWFQRARMLAVQVRNPQRDSVMERAAEIKIKGQKSGQSTGWYYLTGEEGYDPDMGLESKIEWSSGNIW